MNERRRWSTVKEAAAHFQMPRRTLYSLVARGRLPAGSVLRLGRQLRFDITAIEAGANVDDRRIRTLASSPILNIRR